MTTGTRPRRRLNVAPPPRPGPARWNPDRYRAGVFLDLAATFATQLGIRTVCPAAADDIGTWCGRCIVCHLRAARAAYAAANPTLPAVHLRAAYAIAVGVAVESDLDTTTPPTPVAAQVLRGAAYDLFTQSLPTAITAVRIVR